MDNYLTPAQAAGRLNVTTHTLRVWDKEGKITTVRTPGNQRRIPESEINRILGLQYTDRPDTPADNFVAEYNVEYSSINGQSLTIERELSAGGSGGNLPILCQFVTGNTERLGLLK